MRIILNGQRKRRTKDPFFGDIDEMFREMEKMMDEELKNFTEKVPKEYIKERKMPDGSTVKELGPFVYGYSMKIGPDGKPEIQEFGNIKKAFKGAPQVKEEREPLLTSLIPMAKSMLLLSCQEWRKATLNFTAQKIHSRFLSIQLSTSTTRMLSCL